MKESMRPVEVFCNEEKEIRETKAHLRKFTFECKREDMNREEKEPSFSLVSDIHHAVDGASSVRVHNHGFCRQQAEKDRQDIWVHVLGDLATERRNEANAVRFDNRVAVDILDSQLGQNVLLHPLNEGHHFVDLRGATAVQVQEVRKQKSSQIHFEKNVSRGKHESHCMKSLSYCYACCRMFQCARLIRGVHLEMDKYL